jgi:peroxin-6
VYVGVAADVASRTSVLAALTRRMVLGACVDLEAVAAAAPPTATGADLYALAADAWAAAADRVDAEAAEEEGEEEEESEEEEVEVEGGAAAAADSAVVVTQADFLRALAGLTPSLTGAELAKYERLRAQYEGGRAA